LENPGVDGRTILRWIFRKWNGAWTGMVYVFLRLGKMAGSCGCGNEPSDSIKCGEFLDLLRNCQLLNCVNLGSLNS
jgi:hypothetical protein